jgi:hypothetical protein
VEGAAYVEKPRECFVVVENAEVDYVGTLACQVEKLMQIQMEYESYLLLDWAFLDYILRQKRMELDSGIGTDMILRRVLDYLDVAMVEFVFPIVKTVIHDEP